MSYIASLQLSYYGFRLFMQFRRLFLYVIHKSNASMMSSAADDDRTLLRRCIPCRTECVWRCLSHRLGSRGVHGRRTNHQSQSKRRKLRALVNTGCFYHNFSFTFFFFLSPRYVIRDGSTSAFDSILRQNQRVRWSWNIFTISPQKNIFTWPHCDI